MEQFSTKKHLIKLFKRYSNGSSTKAVSSFIEKYYDLFGRIGKEDDLNEDEKEALERKIESYLENHIYNGRKTFIQQYRYSFYIAASLLLTVLAGTLLYYSFTQRNHTESYALHDVISPGKDKAFVTIGDGPTIDLADTSKTIVIKNQTLTYSGGKSVGDLLKKNGQKAQQITIHTPRGAQYNVVLPDGSSVWLNASSTLEFPSSFDGSNQRAVKLSGEGYFEVAKNPNKKFVVQSDKQTVEVLGTKFNISSYPDDYTVKTSVKEGLVKVTSSIESVLLKTKQTSSLVKGKLYQENTDLDKALAWKNGYFYFEDDKIEDIMRELGRWYDIDVQYAGNMPKSGFVGRISKYANIKDVLALFESTKLVKFKIEGRRIIVSQ
ncbi:FecR domain-containing protein [Sphingobacterium sp.]|uniref:FecR family protein n=1 Tax=Sphingobacterium sp. TaxID=341027 RepID=UPI0028A09D95|nr:FecR domain-containing protein [Sphingobacterium sp.]